MLNETAARIFCDTLSRVLPSQAIERDARPYLVRYFVAGNSRRARRHAGAAVYLHHFVASDEPHRVHSHPWAWSTSVILAGGYRETRCAADGSTSVRVYRAGDVNTLAPADRHRIELLGGDCWTLFLAGAWVQPWSFSTC